MKIFTHPPIDEITLPNVLYALGDQSRLKIVKNLLDSPQPLNCIDAVVGIEDLPISTRSHCFQLLRQAGLIRTEKKGRACYSELREQELAEKFPGLIATIAKLLKTPQE